MIAQNSAKPIPAQLATYLLIMTLDCNAACLHCYTITLMTVNSFDLDSRRYPTRNQDFHI